MKTSLALVIMDTQGNMFDEVFSLYNGGRIIKVLSRLIEAAREKNVAVI